MAKKCNCESTDYVSCLDLCKCLTFESTNDSILVTRDKCTFDIQLGPVTITTTANNGLNKNTSTNFQLGGPLTKDTTIDTSTFDFILGGTGNKLTIAPGVFTMEGTLITHVGDQETSEVDRTWFKNNVGIGINAEPNGVNDSINSNTKLIVGKGGLFTNSPIEVSAAGILSMGSNGLDVSTGIYAGSFGNLVLSYPSNQTFRAATGVAGAYSYLQYATNADTTGGNISSSAAQSFFALGGDLDKIIGYRAMSPVPDAVAGYTGTIALAIGHQIDDQQAIMPGNITTSQGLVQKGSGDTNYFAGAVQFGGSDDPVAAAPTNPVDIYSSNIRMRTSRTPASAAASGRQGEVCWDSSYIYVCTATNTWKRSAIATW